MKPFNHFVGIVEDISDPLHLGRTRVRIFGIHNSDRNLLPTEDLPWAMPILPVTSSGISGIGNSPTGLVRGTMVVGFFFDGDAMQQPMVFGSIPGTNQWTNEQREYFASQSEGIYPPGITELPDPYKGNEVPDYDRPPLNETGDNTDTERKEARLNKSFDSGEYVRKYRNYQEMDYVREKALPSIGTLGPIDEVSLIYFRYYLALRESGYNYQAKNSFGFLGKYQMGALALIDAGFVNAGFRQNSSLNNPDAWKKSSGATNMEDFLNTPLLQELAFVAFTKKSYQYCTNAGAIVSSDDARTQLGVLTAAHLLGAGGAKTWRFENSKKADAYGTTGGEYFALGSYAYDVAKEGKNDV